MVSLSRFGRREIPGALELFCNVEIDNRSEEFAFRIFAESSVLARISPQPAAFVLAFLIPAMERGEDIFVDASLDHAFLHRLQTYAISMLASKNSAFKKIDVHAAGTHHVKASSINLGAMTGMSCGVDSLRTLMVYGPDGENVPDKYRLKWLSVFDVGAFHDSELQFHPALDRAKSVAERSGCQAIGVSAQMQQYYSQEFAKSCTVRNVAAAMCLTDITDTYLVSSTYPWNVIGADKRAPTAMEAVDPILLPLLSHDGLEMFSACANEGRHNKVLEIIDRSPFVHEIDMCTRAVVKRDYRINCGTCQKCADFLLAAELIGKLDYVAHRFDMEAFNRRRFRIYQRIVTDTVIMRWTYPNLARPLDIEKSLKVPFGSIFLGSFAAYCILVTRWIKTLFKKRPPRGKPQTVPLSRLQAAVNKVPKPDQIS